MSADRTAESTWEEIKADVDWAIDQLPDDLREPLVLRFLQGKPQTAVAEELGISQPAVSRRLGKALERLRTRLGKLGLGMSVVGLAALLETHAVEAAPATLIANLGRMALAGVPPAPAASPLGSLLGPAASMGPGSKVLGLVMVALTIGAIVQQVTQVAPAGHQRPVVQETATEPAARVEAPSPARGPSGDHEKPATARPANDESRPGKSPGERPRPAAGSGPGRPSRAARRSGPTLGAPASGLGPREDPAPRTGAEDQPPTVSRVPRGPRVAQADVDVGEAAAPPALPGAARQPAGDPPEPAVAGASVYLSPSGWVSISDGDGLLATLWLIVFGQGWIPEDQRRVLTGFPVPEAPGWWGFAGEIPVFGTGDGTALYAQRSRATGTGVEVEYDVTFNKAMKMDGLTLALRVPRERFAGDAVALCAADQEVAVITLPGDLEGYRLGTAEAERLDIAPYPDPLFSVSVTEPGAVPLPLRVSFVVQDLRPYDLDEYEVQIGGLMAAGQDVSPDTNWSLRLSLEFPGALPFAGLQPPQTTVRPGVQLCRGARVEGAFCERVADVVSTAKQAYEGLFPALAKEGIRVCVLPATSGHDNLVTNRRDTIYLRERDGEFGQAMRADAGPIGMLCQAVAELYNPGHLPGLDRLVAHRHLVPAVIRELGAGILASPHTTPLAADGPDMLKVLTSDAYAPVHPDFAAAKALAAIEDALGWDGLRALPDETPANMQPNLEGLRWAAAARDPLLDGAFAAYDGATHIEFGDDGTHLIASFEPDETIRTVSSHPLRTTAEDLVLVASPGLQVSPSDEWATDGVRSLRLHADQPQPGTYVAIADPDWQLRDWRRFSGLEMDLMLQTEGREQSAALPEDLLEQTARPEQSPHTATAVDRSPRTGPPEQLRILVMDDVGGAHAQAKLLRPLLTPGITIHASCDLTPWLPGVEPQPESECRGSFRSDEVALLYIDFPHPAGQPMTLYIDNIRVTASRRGRMGE